MASATATSCKRNDHEDERELETVEDDTSRRLIVSWMSYIKGLTDE